MDKNILRYMSLYEGCDFNVQDEPEEDIVDVEKTDLDLILDEIFSPDPVSGLPKGDIQYYLSKDGNPQIKAWLENNLLAPRQMSSGFDLEGVTDDLIAEMSPMKDESFEDYVARLDSIRKEAIDNSVINNK